MMDVIGTSLGGRRPTSSDTSLVRAQPLSLARATAQKRDEVLDEQGRRRFHGAFTGGWSAGFFNTVGSKEGWTPQTFVSSRAQRHEYKTADARAFMDDEDEAQMMGVGSLGVNRQYDSHGVRAMEDGAQVAAAAGGGGGGGLLGGDIPLELLVPTSVSIGKQMLQHLGWRSGQPLGPRHAQMSRQAVAPSSDDGGATDFSAAVRSAYGLDPAVESLEALWASAALRAPALAATDLLGGSGEQGSGGGPGRAAAAAGVGFIPRASLQQRVLQQRRGAAGAGETATGGAAAQRGSGGGSVGSGGGVRAGALRSLGMGRDALPLPVLAASAHASDGSSGGSAALRLMGGAGGDGYEMVGGGDDDDDGFGYVAYRPPTAVDYDDAIGGDGAAERRNQQPATAKRRKLLLKDGTVEKPAGAAPLLLHDDGTDDDDKDDDRRGWLTDDLPPLVPADAPLGAAFAALAQRFPPPRLLPRYRAPRHVFSAAEDAALQQALAAARERRGGQPAAGEASAASSDPPPPPRFAAAAHPRRLQQQQQQQRPAAVRAAIPELADRFATATPAAAAAAQLPAAPELPGGSGGGGLVTVQTLQAQALLAAATAAPAPPPPPSRDRGLPAVTRIVSQWVPCRVLLKRFNVPDPLPKAERQRLEPPPSEPAAAAAGGGGGDMMHQRERGGSHRGGRGGRGGGRDAPPGARGGGSGGGSGGGGGGDRLLHGVFATERHGSHGGGGSGREFVQTGVQSAAHESGVAQAAYASGGGLQVMAHSGGSGGDFDADAGWKQAQAPALSVLLQPKAPAELLASVFGQG